MGVYIHERNIQGLSHNETIARTILASTDAIRSRRQVSSHQRALETNSGDVTIEEPKSLDQCMTSTGATTP